MAQRLADLADAVDPATNFYASAERVRMLQAQTMPEDPRERFSFEMRLARDLIQNGQTRDALAIYEQLTASLAPSSPANVRMLAGLRKLRALTWLRLGEQENCLKQHGSRSCLIPIDGNGVHVDQQGSRTAIREYLAALRDEPRDLTSIWLLNIAFMTLGEYPDQVPPQWRIPPAVFASSHDVGRFEDGAGPAGVGLLTLLGGSVMEDLDGDGWLDLMVSSWGLRDQMHFLHANGDGTFDDRTADAGLLGLTGGLNMVDADYDNDGDTDILLLRGAYLGRGGRIPNSLIRNNGDAIFEDVTEAAGLLDFHPTQTAAWGDFDGDGWIDLFVGNETIDAGAAPNLFVNSGEGEEDVHPCQLFHNNQDGTFTDVAPSTGVDARGIVKAVLWGDIDNDGRPDLFLSRMTQPNLLFHNDGPDTAGRWHFSDITDRAGVADPVHSFPGWFFDYDNDGWLDLFVSGYGLASRNGSATDVVADYLGLPTQAERLHVYRNNGDSTFTNTAPSLGVDRVAFTMGCNFGDLDNDGWLDFYLGTGEPDLRAIYPNRMFRNDAGRAFTEVTTSGGFGHIQKGHGISFGDIDNDGDQDIHAVMGGAYSGDVYQNALFVNPGHGHHWITLRLTGVTSNRSAIGARIDVTIDENGTARHVHRLVGTGGSFGASPLRAEIGLGDADRIRSVEIVWPASGQVQRFADVTMDRGWRIREDRDDLQPLPLTPYRLATTTDDPRRVPSALQTRP